MTELGAILTALGLASTKYVVALAFIFGYNFSFWESLALAMGGGMLGIFIFSYCADALKQVWQYFFPKKGKGEVLKINSMLRFIVRVRQKYGLAGIAFLTPLVLTVPVGAIVANMFYKNKLQVFAYMFVAFAFWSLLLCGLNYFMGIGDMLSNIFL